LPIHVIVLLILWKAVGKPGATFTPCSLSLSKGDTVLPLFLIGVAAVLYIIAVYKWWTPFRQQRFHIEVDYDRPLQDVIADGRWHVESEIMQLSRVARTGQRRVIIELLRLRLRIDSGMDIPTKISALGYRSATIEELLAFGKKYQFLQYRFTIVALGSRCSHPYWGLTMCPALISQDLGQVPLYLSLLPLDLFPWDNPRLRFAAVKTSEE
jgi:hypothetical protein